MDLVLDAVLIVGTATVLAVVVVQGASRLVDVRAGFVRTVGAGVVGLAVFSAFGWFVNRPTEQPLIFATVQLGASVVGAMAFLGVAEAVARGGGSASPLHWRRRLIRRVGRTRRYLQVVGILRRHGLTPRRVRRELAHTEERQDLARSLRSALEECGVAFVKLGQLLSTRHDLVPPEVIDELSRLRDRAAPIPWDQVAEVLTEDLGPLDAAFAEIEREPLASASIAQVHRARLHSGERVAVKVRRPGLQPMIELDLDIATTLAASLERRAQWARAFRVSELAAGLAGALREELDLRIEAANTTQIGRRTGVDGRLRVPAIHPAMCSQRVLVMEFVEGTSPDRTASLAQDTRHDLAIALLDGVLAQILDHGTFHADPHPGNLLVDGRDRLVLLDFGSVGRLDRQLRDGIARLLVAVDRDDSVAASDALLGLLDRPADLDERRFQRAVGRYIVTFVSGARPVDATMFAELFRLVASHGLAIPPEMAAVFRALATLEGTLATLDPEFDMFDEARLLARARMGDLLEPKELRAVVEQELVAVLPILRELPRRADRLTAALEQDRLGLNTRILSGESERRLVDSLVERILLTLLAAATGVMGAVLVAAGGGPEVNAEVGLHQLFGYNLLVISIVLVLRVLVLIGRTRR